MTSLLIAEHDNNQLADASLKAAGAAACFKQDCHLLVAGENCAGVAEQAAKIENIKQVLHADHAIYNKMLAEPMAALIANLAGDYNVIMAPATMNGKNYMPRVAALLDMPQVSDVTAILANDTFEHPIYAGNAIETVKNTAEKKILTIRTTAFAPPALTGQAEIKMIDKIEDPALSKYVGEELTKSDRPELTSAKIVISGGRGMQSGENFALLEKIADKLGAAIGASRAAVDAGYVPNDYQVGQTGKVVAPELYIAVGISGAIQHLAGMKDAKIIVAINKDEEAPIFQIADYGLVADLFTVLPELEAALDKA